MNVLFVMISTVPFGSNDLLAYRAAEELLRRGHRVLMSPWDWAHRNAPKYDQIRAKGALLVMRNPHQRPDNFFLRQFEKARHWISDPLTEWRFADKFHPDAIVISDPATYHFLSVPGLTKFIKGGKFAYFTISQYNDENGYLNEQSYITARSVFAKARRCFFVSHRNLNVARRQLCCDLPHALVVHNPPNLHDWRCLPFPSSEQASYCIVGRLECGVKGQALVLEAFAEPIWRERIWSLSIFGSGPDEAYLQDLIKYLGLECKVRMCGFADDVRSVWSGHQILIMASSGEGKPLAVTEAMLCGRPAVVTDVGGNAELVSDGITGFVAQSATLAGVGDALERSWIARHSWEKMGLRAHDWAAEALDPPPGNVVASTIVDAMST